MIKNSELEMSAETISIKNHNCYWPVVISITSIQSYDSDTKSYDSDTQGYDSETQGCDSDTQGYDSGTQGYDSSIQWYDSDTQGYDSDMIVIPNDMTVGQGKPPFYIIPKCSNKQARLLDTFSGYWSCISWMLHQDDILLSVSA